MAQQQDHAPVPWESEGEYTAYFDQVRNRRAANTSNRNVPDHDQKAEAKDLSNPETKVNDARPVMKEDVDARPGTIHKRSADRADYNENQKASNRMNGTTYPSKPAGRSIMNSERRLAPERAPVSRRNTAAGYVTPERDVIVPPFPTSEGNDASAGENYTGIFNAVADKNRTLIPPSHQISQNADAKNKGNGIWKWFLGCFGSK